METLLQGPLDDEDAQMISHVLGPVGNLVHVSDKIAQLHPVAQAQLLLPENVSLEPGGDFIGFGFPVRNFVHMVGNGGNVFEKSPCRTDNGLHGFHDAVDQLHEIFAEFGIDIGLFNIKSLHGPFEPVQKGVHVFQKRENISP